MPMCSVPGCAFLSPGLRTTPPQGEGPAHRSREDPDPIGLCENKARSRSKTRRQCWGCEHPRPLQRGHMGGDFPQGLSSSATHLVNKIVGNAAEKASVPPGG